MTDECDQPQDDWPNDAEVNDMMLAYAATEELRRSGRGCAGIVLLLFITTSAVVWTVIREL